MVHVHLTGWRQNGRGIAIWRAHVVVGMSSVRASRVIAQLIHARKTEFVVVVIKACRLTHASVAKSIKDVNVARRQAKVGLLGCKLEHRVRQRRDEVVDLAEKKRQESVITRAKHRKNVQDLVKLFTRAHLEGDPPRWLVGKHVGKSAGDAEKLLDQGQARKTEVAREISNHGKQVVGDINRIWVRKTGLCAVSARHRQLP